MINLDQIAQTLKGKGFSVQVHNETVVVSLNRSINIMEVWIALNYQVEQERMSRYGKAVIIQ